MNHTSQDHTSASATSLRPMLGAFALLLVSACGGPEGLEQSTEALRVSAGTQSSAGTCSNVCSEVVACCVCHCHQDYPAPGSYACDVGCLVLDTIFGDDEEAPLGFVDASGGFPRAAPYVVNTGGRLSIEAGQADTKGNFKSVDGLSMRMEIIHLDDFLAADARGVTPRFSSLGSVRGRDTRFRSVVSLRGYVAGPYILQLTDGQTSARTMVEIR